MKLKTVNVLAIERGKPVKDSTDIKLCGNKCLCEVDDLKLFIEAQCCNKKNSFLHIFGLDTKFFYSLEIRTESNKLIERGLGHLEQTEEGIVLKRIQPYYSIHNDIPNNLKEPTSVDHYNCKDIIVTSYHPTTFIELLTDANSVITSSFPYIPSSTQINTNSLLGRLDKEIESITIDSLINSDKVVQLLKSYTKQLVLQSSKIDVKRLTTNNIQFNATNTAPERPGVLYFNNQTNELMFFNGTEWKVIETK